ncbi:unnamed protein product, partial [Closterium sp. NIES-64]
MADKSRFERLGRDVRCDGTVVGGGRGRVLGTTLALSAGSFNAGSVATMAEAGSQFGAQLAWAFAFAHGLAAAAQPPRHARRLRHAPVAAARTRQRGGATAAARGALQGGAAARRGLGRVAAPTAVAAGAPGGVSMCGVRTPRAAVRGPASPPRRAAFLPALVALSRAAAAVPPASLHLVLAAIGALALPHRFLLLSALVLQAPPLCHLGASSLPSNNAHAPTAVVALPRRNARASSPSSASLSPSDPPHAPSPQQQQYRRDFIHSQLLAAAATLALLLGASAVGQGAGVDGGGADGQEDGEGFEGVEGGGEGRVVRLWGVYRLVEQVVNSNVAPTFASLALLSSFHLSTPTNAYAGQLSASTFAHVHLRPWHRFLLTRALTLPLLLLLSLTLGDAATLSLLSHSQLLLALLLPLAAVPLVRLAASPALMGRHRVGPALELVSWAACLSACALSVWFLGDALLRFATAEAVAGGADGDDIGGMGLWEWVVAGEFLSAGGGEEDDGEGLAVGLSPSAVWRNVRQLVAVFGGRRCAGQAGGEARWGERAGGEGGRRGDMGTTSPLRVPCVWAAACVAAWRGERGGEGGGHGGGVVEQCTEKARGGAAAAAWGGQGEVGEGVSGVVSEGVGGMVAAVAVAVAVA